LAVSLLNDLSEPFLTRAKRLVVSSLQRIMRDVNNRAMKLNLSSSKVAYSDIQEVCHKLSNTNQFLQDKDNAKNHIVDNLASGIEKQLTKAKDLVNENLKKRLEKIESNMHAMNFFESFESLSVYDECIACLDDLLVKETEDKNANIDKELKKHINKIQKEYTERNFDEYNMYPLSALFEKLDRVSGSYTVREAREKIKKDVYRKYVEKLKELRKKGACLLKGLRNNEYLQMKSSLSSLPSEIEKSLEISFSNFEEEFKEEKSLMSQGLDHCLRNYSVERNAELE